MCPKFGGGTESWLRLPAWICSVRLGGTRILCLGQEKASEKRGLCFIRVVFMEREGKNRLGWEMRKVVISGSSSVPDVPSLGRKRRFPHRAWKGQRRGGKRSHPKGFSRALGVGIGSSLRCLSPQTVPRFGRRFQRDTAAGKGRNPCTRVIPEGVTGSFPRIVPGLSSASPG